MEREHTLVLIKPDAVARGLVGAITTRLEQRGLQMIGSKMCRATPEILYRHYLHLVDKPYYSDIVSSMTTGPLIAQVWSGYGAVAVVRSMIGATNPVDAAPGTIRGDYGLHVGRNLIHASENLTCAEEEIKLWFQMTDLCLRDDPLENLIYRLR